MPLSTFNPRYSLRIRIALIVAGLTLTLSIVLTVITGQITGQQLDHSIGQTLAQLSANVVGQLDQTMFERWREIRITASQLNLYSSRDNAPQVRALLDQLKDSYRFYSWIGWADPSGTVIASTDGVLEGQSVAAENWFQQAQNSQTPYIGDIHENLQIAQLLPAIDNEPTRFVDIAMPIKTPDGKLLGVLGTYIDSRFMREQPRVIEQQYAKLNGLSTTSPHQIDVFVLASDGTVILGPPFFSAFAMNSLPKLSLQSIQNARLGQTGYVTETWLDGSKAYLTGYSEDSGYRGYSGLNWIVLIREQADVALASVTQLQLLLLGIGVFFAASFSVIGWWLAIQITRPLIRIAALAHDIKTGDVHDTAPGLPARADEVSVLSHTIDRLLVSLNTRNTQLTELNSNLERRIQERTAELTASQRFNEKIVSTVPDMLYISDLVRGNTIYVNQSTNMLIGYDAAEMRATDADLQAHMIHPDDLAAYQSHQERMREAPDGPQLELTYRVQHHDGHWIWVHARETVFARDTQGRVTQVFGVAQDITLRKQAEDKLQETAAAQERQRLARELHDSVSQTLFSATMIAQTLPLLWDRGEVVVKKNLEELARLTRGALAEMRTLLNELRPTAIETADLTELLNQLLDAARGRTKADYTLILDGEGSLSPEVQIAVYRVAQEALNNVTKHARALHVQIQLEWGMGQLEMRIKDDGRGFNHDHALPDHFGLDIMRERAAEVGAQVEIASQPGRGTEVRFTWHAAEPIHAAVEEIEP
ncbi:MAG: histidine kinase [Chloroflexota bacterium]